MTVALVILGVVVVGLLTWVLLKKRANKKKHIQGHLKHPGNLVRYHDNTSVHIREALKIEASEKKSGSDAPSRVAVLRFRGDIKASARLDLSRCIDEVILNKEQWSEVVLCVESPGGGVAEYGHASAEVERLRTAGLRLVICVDTVAASGGYLMSLPAHEILAAPYAMVGSIGVVSFVPNLRKLLQRYDVEPRTFTAGKFKRTVTLTDNATPEEVQNYVAQLESIHEQFRHSLKKYRPQVDLDRVATGEFWLAQASVEQKLSLVDRLVTSAEYLLEKNREQDLVEFKVREKNKNWLARVMPKNALQSLVSQVIEELWSRAERGLPFRSV